LLLLLFIITIIIIINSLLLSLFLFHITTNCLSNLVIIHMHSKN